MGIEALNELKTEGRKIPEEVSVITIGGGQASKQTRPSLSAMGGGEEPISEKVLDILERNINNHNMEPEKEVVRNRLILRESTAKREKQL